MLRRYQRGAALVCLGIAWLVASGCQGPQLDRLDGSTSTYSSGEPIVDNGPPLAHPTHDTSASPGVDALAQSHPLSEAAIAENLNCGHREAALSHYEQAEVYYRKALDLDPDNPLANHRLAILADRRGDFAVSERCYLKAIGREPNNADLLSDLGYSYYLQGRTRESERCLQAALRSNPLHQLALDNLSLLYAKLGDRERTFDVLKRSLGESAAQARLAQLFPPSRTTVPEDETFTASFAPVSGHETQVAAHAPADQSSGTTTQHPTTKPNEQRPAPSSASVVATDASPTFNTPPQNALQHTAERASGATQTPLEKQLAALMERERQRALDERAQRQEVVSSVPPPPAVTPAAPPVALPAPQPFTHWSNPSSSTATQPQPAATASVPSTSFGAVVAPHPIPTSPIPTDRVPDDRINDAFSAIDREGTESASAPTSSADAFTAPTRPTPARQAVPTAANAPWDQPAATARVLAPGEEPAPVAPSPQRSLTSENPMAGAFPPVATTPPDSGLPTTAASQNLTAPTPARTVGGTNNSDARTASVSNSSDEWDAARSGTPATQPALTPSPDLNVPSSTANAPSPARNAGPSWTAASLAEEGQNPSPEITISSGSTPPPKPSADANGWDRDPDPTPQWPGTGGVNAADRAPSGATATANSFDWQANPSPRIVPVSVAPAPRASERVQQSPTSDALDDFEAQLQKNRRTVTPGKSTSNAAIAAKPSIQPLPRDRQTAANGAASGASDPWSPQIQPRREPPTLFVPDDTTNADKKPAPAAAATNWSDLPTWQSPASASPPGDNGPAIHPGS